jgi:hypothetical protein
MAISWVV